MAVKKFTLDGNGYDSGFDGFVVFILPSGSGNYSTARYHPTSQRFEKYNEYSYNWEASSYTAYFILKHGESFSYDFGSKSKICLLVIPFKNNKFRFPQNAGGSLSNVTCRNIEASGRGDINRLGRKSNTVFIEQPSDTGGIILNNGVDATLQLRSGITMCTEDYEPVIPLVTGYSITYHADGGTPEPENLTGKTTLPSPLPTVSKPNFTFEGWYLDSTFQTPAVDGAEISADTDLYAKFTRSHITLDLSTIGLSEGTHSIQMKLSDDEVTKADSALSNAVSYTPL